MTDDISAFRILIRLIIVIAMMMTCFFVSAGTFYWPEAWFYLVGYFLFALSLLFWLKRNNPDLLRKRMTVMKKSARPWDKKFSVLSLPFYFAALIVPGLDAVRFQWSRMPWYFKAVGFAVSLVSLGLFTWVIRENSYLSRLVEIQKDQKVVTTGPYQFVRHPMYVAASLLFLSMSIALGSWWGLIPAGCVVTAMIIRTLLEERMLNEELSGYLEYTQRVKYRFIPGVW